MVVCFLFLIFSCEQGKIALDFNKERIMQDNAMSKWLPPLMAFCLSFIIIATLAPITGIQADRQLDFWLLWLAAMLIAALPLCYLEIALAKRSKTTALQALSSLTRDADASSKWRLAGWLAAVFIPFLAGGMLSNAAQATHQLANAPASASIFYAGLALAAFALSLAARPVLVALTAAGVLASLILANVFGTGLPAWHVTPVEFGEWGSAAVLALVASGLGMGLYWQSSLSAVQVSAPGVATSPTPVASGSFHGQSQGAGIGVGDMLTPLQRVEPVYPYRAQQAGIEGSVTLRFSVDAEGRVQDVEVIDAKPKRQFERAAIQAVSKWRYQPRPGATDKLVQTINLKFKLES